MSKRLKKDRETVKNIKTALTLREKLDSHQAGKYVNGQLLQ